MYASQVLAASIANYIDNHTPQQVIKVIPGDIQNRFNQTVSWLTTYKADQLADGNYLFKLITDPGQWQERTLIYISQLNSGDPSIGIVKTGGVFKPAGDVYTAAQSGTDITLPGSAVNQVSNWFSNLSTPELIGLGLASVILIKSILK